MIKAKCRGYEGALERLNADIVRDMAGNAFAIYDLQIEIKRGERVLLYAVRGEEIEISNS